jgi:hypothetical protein
MMIIVAYHMEVSVQELRRLRFLHMLGHGANKYIVYILTLENLLCEGYIL